MCHPPCVPRPRGRITIFHFSNVSNLFTVTNLEHRTSREIRSLTRDGAGSSVARGVRRRYTFQTRVLWFVSTFSCSHYAPIRIPFILDMPKRGTKNADKVVIVVTSLNELDILERTVRKYIRSAGFFGWFRSPATIRDRHKSIILWTRPQVSVFNPI